MALIKCPDCGKEVSDLAPACIGCGCPMDRVVLRCPDCGKGVTDYKAPACVQCGRPMDGVVEEKLKTTDTPKPELDDVIRHPPFDDIVQAPIDHTDKSPYSIPPDSFKSVAKAESHKELPMRWLQFYGACRVFGGVVSVLIMLLLIIGEAKKGSSAGVTLYGVMLLASVGYAVVGYGLLTIKPWAWEMNRIVLMMDLFLMPLYKLNIADYGLTYFVHVVLTLLIWVWPNMIYFKKRRHMFS